MGRGLEVRYAHSLGVLEDADTYLHTERRVRGWSRLPIAVQVGSVSRGGSAAITELQCTINYTRVHNSESKVKLNIFSNIFCAICDDWNNNIVHRQFLRHAMYVTQNSLGTSSGTSVWGQLVNGEKQQQNPSKPRLYGTKSTSTKRKEERERKRGEACRFSMYSIYSYMFLSFFPVCLCTS